MGDAILLFGDGLGAVPDGSALACNSDAECCGGLGPCCSASEIGLAEVHALGPGTGIEDLQPFDLGQRWEACLRDLYWQEVSERETNMDSPGVVTKTRRTETYEIRLPVGADGIRLGRCLVANQCTLPGTTTIDPQRACYAMNLVPMTLTVREQRWEDDVEVDDQQSVEEICVYRHLRPYWVSPGTPVGSTLDLNPLASDGLGLGFLLIADVGTGEPRSGSRSVVIPPTDPAPPGFEVDEEWTHEWAWGTEGIEGESSYEYADRLAFFDPADGWEERRVSQVSRAAIDVQTLIDCDGLTVNGPYSEESCPTDAGGCDGGEQDHIVGVACDPAAADLADALPPIWPAVNVTACRVVAVGGLCWKVAPSNPRIRLGDAPSGTELRSDVIDEDSTLPTTCCECDDACGGDVRDIETCSGNETGGEIVCCGTDAYTVRVTRFEMVDRLTGADKFTYEYSLLLPGLYRRLPDTTIVETPYRIRRRIIETDTDTEFANDVGDFTVPGTPPGTWVLPQHPTSLVGLGANAVPTGCPKDVGRAFTFSTGGVNYVGFVRGLEFFHTCNTQRVTGSVSYYPEGTPTEPPPTSGEVGESSWTIEIETTADGLTGPCGDGCDESGPGGGSSPLPLVGGCGGCGRDALDEGGL
jgi:hypothetical protein